MICYFCQRAIREIDFREIQVLEKFISAAGKIKSQKKTNLCSYHQRRLAQAIKRARYLALLPYIK